MHTAHTHSRIYPPTTNNQQPTPINSIKTADELRAALRAQVVALLQPPPGLSPELQLAGGRPAVLLIAGVNGAGKTTTIGALLGWLARLGGHFTVSLVGCSH
jgi:signal recognition particle GTPase